MSYIHSQWTSSNRRYIIEKKYHAWRYMPHTPAIKEKRAPKSIPTNMTQERINQRRRAERTMRLVLDNFEAGDSYLTLTFCDRPQPDEVKDALAKFKRDLRTIFQKSGKTLKYISVIENMRSRGRPHVHLLIPALTSEEMKKAIKKWKLGRVKIETYQGGALDARKLADYFEKEEIDPTTGSGRVMPSRNLTRTEPKKKVISKSETYRDKIQAPPGYKVIDILSVNIWTDEGYPIQIAVYERIDEDDKARRSRGAPSKCEARRRCNGGGGIPPKLDEVRRRRSEKNPPGEKDSGRSVPKAEGRGKRKSKARRV